MRQSTHRGPALLSSGLWRQQQFWPWRRRPPAEPVTAMFRRIRLRLVAWYIGILVAIFSIAGILLFVCVQAAVLGPVNDALAASARNMGEGWRTSGVIPCSPQTFAIPATASVSRATTSPTFQAVSPVFFLACYDRHGRLLSTNAPLSDMSPATLARITHGNLAQSALASRSAADTIDAGTSIGAVARYALSLRNAHGAIVGVVQVSAPVQEYENSLRTLASLLCVVGGLTVACAGVGGWFLATRALEPARLAARRQQAFLADAAHELRTPLTLLRADTEALQYLHDRLSPEDSELLAAIVCESDHMGHMLGQLLTLARLDAGAAHPEMDIVDLNKLLSGAVQRAQALARQQQVTLVASSSDPVYALGDEALLDQATMILLENAIKYNQPGGSVSLHARQSAGWAKVEVRDTGIGMNAVHLAHLGERFYRADAAHTSRITGAGLGISIARRIATLHRGSLTYESVPEQGTTATLIVPAAVPRPPKSWLHDVPLSEAAARPRA